MSIYTHLYIAYTVFAAFLVLLGYIFFQASKVRRYLQIHHKESLQKLTPPVAGPGFVLGYIPVTFYIWRTNRLVHSDKRLSVDSFLVKQISFLKNLIILAYIYPLFFIAVLILLISY
jgi:hypothetical protein